MSNLGGNSMSEDTDRSNNLQGDPGADGTNGTNGTNGTDGADGADGAGTVVSIVGGTNCSVDSSDVANPIVNADDQSVTKIDISSFIQGVLEDSEKVSTFVVTTAATLPSALSNSKAYAEVVATANATIDVQVNDVSKGSINFALGANAATFTFASPVVLIVGDRIQLIAQGTADATLADVSITIRGTL